MKQVPVAMIDRTVENLAVKKMVVKRESTHLEHLLYTVEELACTELIPVIKCFATTLCFECGIVY